MRDLQREISSWRKIERTLQINLEERIVYCVHKILKMLYLYLFSTLKCKIIYYDVGYYNIGFVRDI